MAESQRLAAPAPAAVRAPARYTVLALPAGGHRRPEPGLVAGPFETGGRRTSAALLTGVPGFADGPFTVDGRTAVGEVTLHNRAELLAALSAAGRPAEPACPDGELLLRCWLALGPDGLRTADGMFTLAVLDGPDLVLLRDHVGARTAFHCRTRDGGWAVSSSLRALRERPDVDTGLDLAAVRSFLTFAYLPGTETLLRGVSELLPGRVTRLGADGSVRTEEFWEPQHRTAGAELTTGQYASELLELLEQAVARRLPAGEDVAVLLSGGVDSSLVTALAARLHDRPVHTYSISFGNELPNELGYSGLVAAHCDTRHRVLTVPGEQVAARLADTVALLDSPVGDPLTVPNLMLAEAVAGDGLSVSLNGEGGDPVFGGPKNLAMLVFELLREDPSEQARADAYLHTYRKCWEDLPVLLTGEALAALDALGPDAHPRRHVAPYLTDRRMPSLLDQLLHCNLRTKGAHHILTKVERLTSSQGVQGRSPLFDRQVVDHAFGTPPALKLRGTEEKWILKEAVRDLLPDTVTYRPKSGMRVPVQQWLRGPLSELAGDLLLGPAARARGLFRPDTVETWMRGGGLLLPRQGGKLWLLLTLELWLRAYDL
ncbi:asparagine synthetase B family protein [Kitasatospora cheerisanensis]|uniref:asparagine synthase (glutamine-hydrolyzing) n=1 Tax=Kitasatospora cheerisanensis KCTC 2395 TaxID=1348663 RepID=A0A066Z0I1_9ACTN|nr:asparagine synthetase B family protein [Kitasatospora cheerisanensis]KDN87288.1 asparagine synthase (glutamine-hydrolysing) [Kitasatospora cheerisanensis KCTC 2395]